MDEGELKKVEKLTVSYTKGGDPTAYLKSVERVVGKVRALHDANGAFHSRDKLCPRIQCWT